MADQLDDQELRYNMPIDKEDIEALHAEENVYPSMESLSHANFTDAIFGAVRGGAKRGLILSNWVLDRWAIIKQEDPNLYLQLVIQQASEVGVSRFLIDEALANKAQRRNGHQPWPPLVGATNILKTQHRLPAWLIVGLISEGLTIIGGLPKVAKSYFAYDIALACAGHGLALEHFTVAKGRVAYLAIEDDPSDTKFRIQQLRPGLESAANLFFLHGEAVPGINEGLLEYVRLIVTEHELSLVIIDPLSYVYDPKSTKQTEPFREAKDMLLPLRQLARELHFSLLFVDHRRKQGKDDVDVFQTLYGSVAKYAVADTLIMMVRRDDEVSLHCRGRKIKDQIIECELTFTNEGAYWKVRGAREPYKAESLQTKIVQAFSEAERLSHRRDLSLGDIMTYGEIENTPQMRETVRTELFRMFKAGKVVKADRNLYLLTGSDDSEGVEV